MYYLAFIAIIFENIKNNTFLCNALANIKNKKKKLLNVCNLLKHVNHTILNKQKQ